MRPSPFEERTLDDGDLLEWVPTGDRPSAGTLTPMYVARPIARGRGALRASAATRPPIELSDTESDGEDIVLADGPAEARLEALDVSALERCSGSEAAPGCCVLEGRDGGMEP
jgi:hypothetical protein